VVRMGSLCRRAGCVQFQRVESGRDAGLAQLPAGSKLTG